MFGNAWLNRGNSYGGVLDSIRGGKEMLFRVVPGLTPRREAPPESGCFRVYGRRPTSMSTSFANEEGCFSLSKR